MPVSQNVKGILAMTEIPDIDPAQVGIECMWGSNWFEMEELGMPNTSRSETMHRNANTKS
jgi:hypothetical protein